ncbi:MAG: glycoside hydrolase family 20 zincin-like fold domain-containing protein [Lachnospiraceae bacterium]
MYFIPQPQKIWEKEGSYCIHVRDVIFTEYEEGNSLWDTIELLNAEIEESLGYRLRIERVGTEAAAGQRGIGLMLSADLKEQEYTLEVGETGIRLRGGSIHAVRYGVQTLRQIIRQQGAIISCLRIEDKPDIANRAFLIDVTRGRIPTLKSLKELADTLSFYKINQLQLYIEHTYMFSQFSEMWRDDTPLQSTDILELDRYCCRLGIELIPCLSSFGHLYKLLRTKGYQHLCEMENPGLEEFSFVGRMLHHTIDISNPESHELIKSMLLQFMQLFSSDTFNLCGDETFDLGKGRSHKLEQEIGHDRMYVGFIKELCEFLIAHGKRPMFWGDIIVKFPELITELPAGTICLNWGYAPNQREEEARILFRAGAIQYLCPGVSGWNQFMNLVRNSYDNIRTMASYAIKYNALGVLNTAWGDYGSINDPKLDRIGQIYGAAFTWNKNIPDYEEINRQISLLEFGDKTEEFVSVIEAMQNYSCFNWEAAVKYREMILWNKFKAEDVFEADKLSMAEKWEKELAGIKDKLYKQILMLKESKRSEALHYINSLEAIEVFNEIGNIIWNRINNKGNALEKECSKIAEKLEIWFYDYKKLWRKNCRESELYRIQEVINWYADYLRG